jgi:hypothetical protein
MRVRASRAGKRESRGEDLIRGRAKAALRFRTKSTHQKDDKTDQQNQTKPATADNRPSKVKTAAAENKKKNND